MNNSAQQTPQPMEQTYSGNVSANGAHQENGQREHHYPTGQTGGEVTAPGSSATHGSEASSGGDSSGASAVMPPVDIFEDEVGITVLADMPGVSKDRLRIKVTGDQLVIEGGALVPSAGAMEVLYGEIRSPHFRRSFTLSRELDPAKIDAKLMNGVLQLRIPKAEEARPRRIEVTVG